MREPVLQIIVPMNIHNGWAWAVVQRGRIDSLEFTNLGFGNLLNAASYALYLAFARQINLGTENYQL